MVSSEIYDDMKLWVSFTIKHKNMYLNWQPNRIKNDYHMIFWSICRPSISVLSYSHQYCTFCKHEYSVIFGEFKAKRHLNTQYYLLHWTSWRKLFYLEWLERRLINWIIFDRFITPDNFYVEPTINPQEVLVIDRSTGKISVIGKNITRNIKNTVSKINIMYC